MPTRPLRLLSGALLLAVVTSACGEAAPRASSAPASTGASEVSAGSSGTEASEDGSDGTSGFPVTVTNCDVEVTFDAPPERVLVLGRAGIFAILHDLGVSDRVVARAGAFPVDYYDQHGRAAIEAVPSLGEDLDESGHLQISQEAIIDTEADLAIGLPVGIDRGGLDEHGIPVLQQPANCPDGIDDAGFDDIVQQVEMYGEIFDRRDRAAQLVADLQARITDVEAGSGAIGAGRSVAVLYPTVGGGTVYAYGAPSLSHEQVTAAGFGNVFADTDERVFEVTAEELIARDPDVLILLHADGDPAPVEQAIRMLPGAHGITAVRDDAILVQLFSFGEYPTPLVVDGLEQIVDTFGPDR